MSSNQSHSDVGRDQAGRDITYNQQTTNYNQYTNTSPSQVQRLLKKLSAQVHASATSSAFIEDLQFYINAQDGEGTVGLEDKLKMAGRENELNDAKRMKELFSKLLTKLENFTSAQELFAYFLAHIHDVFRHKIIPCCGTMSYKEIEATVDLLIIDKIMTEIGDGCDLFTINRSHIRGMIYWLADKCYVRWHE